MVSKTTVVPCQRASERQNSSQIFNVQVINRDLKTRQKQTDVSNTSLLSYIPNLTTDYFQYLSNCAPPCPNLTSPLACYQLIVIRLGEEYVRSLLRYWHWSSIRWPLTQFLLEEKNAQSYTPPKNQIIVKRNNTPVKIKCLYYSDSLKIIRITFHISCFWIN